MKRRKLENLKDLKYLGNFTELENKETEELYNSTKFRETKIN